MPSTLPKKKISTAKAAKILGVSRWTLRRWGNKKLIPFTASRSGYRYYKEEDLLILQKKHVIVRTVSEKSKSKKNVSSTVIVAEKDETLLLPLPPKPKEISEQKSKNELVVPPPAPTPKKQSTLSRFWKILPFTAFVLLLLSFGPGRLHQQKKFDQKNILGVSIEKPSSIIPFLSFRDVVLAAATDSSDLSSSSVQFFLSEESEPVDTILSPDGETPQSGNTIYLSSMTDFSSFEESPFAYLNGSHGPAGPVAIIDNEEMLRSHPFFANVHNGDKLLIYKEDGKAVLFRPLTNEVIAFAPLDAVPSTSYQQIHGQPVVALRNGMGTPVDMKTFEAELLYVEPESVVVDNQNAMRSDYKKSIIVDVVGNKKDEAQALAYKLRLTLSDLPEGEYRPPAGVDFLVILGKDRVTTLNYIAPTSTSSATKR